MEGIRPPPSPCKCPQISTPFLFKNKQTNKPSRTRTKWAVDLHTERSDYQPWLHIRIPCGVFKIIKSQNSIP